MRSIRDLLGGCLLCGLTLFVHAGCDNAGAEPIVNNRMTAPHVATFEPPPDDEIMDTIDDAARQVHVAMEHAISSAEPAGEPPLSATD